MAHGHQYLQSCRFINHACSIPKQQSGCKIRSPVLGRHRAALPHALSLRKPHHLIARPLHHNVFALALDTAHPVSAMASMP